jgi:hypothetical protein
MSAYSRNLYRTAVVSTLGVPGRASCDAARQHVHQSGGGNMRTTHSWCNQPWRAFGNRITAEEEAWPPLLTWL